MASMTSLFSSDTNSAFINASQSTYIGSYVSKIVLNCWYTLSTSSHKRVVFSCQLSKLVVVNGTYTNLSCIPVGVENGTALSGAWIFLIDLCNADGVPGQMLAAFFQSPQLSLLTVRLVCAFGASDGWHLLPGVAHINSSKSSSCCRHGITRYSLLHPITGCRAFASIAPFVQLPGLPCVYLLAQKSHPSAN